MNTVTLPKINARAWCKGQELKVLEARGADLRLLPYVGQQKEIAWYEAVLWVEIPCWRSTSRQITLWTGWPTAGHVLPALITTKYTYRPRELLYCTSNGAPLAIPADMDPGEFVTRHTLMFTSEQMKLLRTPGNYDLPEDPPAPTAIIHTPGG
jgi:hypothetical protein